MTGEKIIRFPTDSGKRWRNRMGVRAVPCLVTERWLQFPDESAPLKDGDYMWVAVMTKSEDGKDKKICSICVSKEDLEKAIKNVA